MPTYRCADQVVRVLEGVDDALAARVREIWVVDNRSPDGTAEAALGVARSGRLPNLRVFRTRQNNSLGGTHKTVFRRAAEVGASHVVVLHGDDQAVAAEVGLLLDRVERDPSVQTVLGSRFSRGSRLVGYDRKRVAGNRVLNVVYSVVTGRRLADLGSGLNCFAVADLDERTYLRFADGLTFNFELLLDLVRRRVAFAYEPITWREEDQVSNARNVKVFTTALANLLRWRLGRPAGPAPAADREYAMDELDPSGPAAGVGAAS
ncbi:glycosyltransferase family 2 protein [Pseudokineococcus marinus]|uniref:glycosyltransferase family 2 protein n=1 Tax=Pseudokineococcus marinus TaxID=351215 RepID=UPI0031D985B2